MEDDELVSEMYYTCMRVKDIKKPYVPSLKRECELCHAEIWLDRRMLRLASASKGLICVPCMVKMEEENG